MRRSTRLAGFSTMVLFAALFRSNERAFAFAVVTIDKPNVLFIAVDDLNDWVGCLGGHVQAKTPNIDRLAKKGVLFEQAYCAAPLCHPSRTAIMTGLRPSTTGIYGNRNWFRDLPKLKDRVTIPQYFRKHGYIAWTGGKIFHQPHGKWSDPVSWDEQYSTRMGTQHPPLADKYRHGMRDLFSNKILARLMDWSPIKQSAEETADWQTAEGAAKFLKRQHDKPFFLACGIYRPHLQWYAPQKYFDMHPIDQVQLPPYLENDLDDVPPKGRAMAGKEFGIIKRKGQWKKAVQGYLAASSFADACVGHVLDALERSPHRENTIVVLWGDHGYHIGDKEHVAKSALWEQTTRTPLIIYAPGKLPSGAPANGKTCKSPVSLVDLYPTLIELCGLPKCTEIDGRSLAPLVGDPNANWPWPAIITHSPHWHGTNHAIRTREFHYIHYSDGKEELYDAQVDQHQWKNLADDSQFAAAKSKLKKWLPKANAKHFRANAATKSDTPRKRPNVVVLLADDLGSKDIGCYGGPVKTPALDELAAKGVRFTDFYSGAPVCSPARATLLTGRHHLRTGVYTVIQDHIHNMHLRKSEVTMAEVLKANGYDTVHVGKWHLGTPFRRMKKPWIDEHGFDHWFATDLNAAPSHRNPTNFWRNRERVGKLKGYACELVVAEAITWLDKKRDAEKPFFLNVWFHEPHAPLAAPDDIVAKYGDLEDPAAIYSATIDNTDRAIARLLKKLKQIGSLDDTIIIYTSDHGSYRPERNGELRGSKGSLFEGGIRTPGIIHWPNGIKGGLVEHTPAGAVDLLPTICGLAGIEKPKGVHLDGADLSPLLAGKRAEFKRYQPLTWHSPTSQPVVVIREGKYSLVGYRKTEYPKDQDAIRAVMDEMKVILEKIHGRKLTQSELWHKAWNSEIKTLEWNRLRGKFVTLNTFQEAWIPFIKTGSGGISKFELYDLSTDPNQKQNIAQRLPEVTKRLKEQVLAINAGVLQEAPEWEPFKPLVSFPTESNPKPASAAAELEKLLTKIDKAALPKAYDPSKHQAYVDSRMKFLKPQQRGRIGMLWKEKRRLHPKIKNAGMSFVRILEYVAAGEKLGEGDSIEHRTRIHRIATTKRSTFDAFTYINRLPDKPYDDESAEDFVGRIFGRLANQEGRILLKAPAGMDRLAYDGFKTFLRYEGASSIGNCAACHTPASFTDGKSHVVSQGGTAKKTPSLRNLVKRRVDLRKTLLQKLTASQQKRSGKADKISDEYSAMKLSEGDIPGLVAFLKLLEDAPADRFRNLILEAKVLDTSEESESE